ncbi:hypothetical protein KKH23_05770 [Patescibacteria group bacterium]|nr:hypothetical protein [Patescibacteria group bacterium]
MDKTVEFTKVIPVTKAYEKDGDLYIEGESSGPELDLDKQFMTPECIQGMAKQVNENPVPYLDEHQKRGVASELGTVISADVTPEYHMKTTTRLDRDNPIAVTLWNKVQKGKKFGQSIAGHVAGMATKVVDGAVYKGFSRIVLDHIANTTKPSWAPSLGTLVAKSLEDEGLDWGDAPEYDGDMPFSAHVVEKGSKPDPQAGKWYTLAEDLLSRLNQKFGWASYQEMIDETNRDRIPFQDLPLAAKLPVGAVELSADDYDRDPDGYVQKIGETIAVEPGMLDIRQMADLYQQLYYLAESLARRDQTNGTKDGKKAVTRINAALTALSEAMRETLSKAERPPEPAIVQKVQEPVPDGTLKSFDDVANVRPVVVQPHAPQPSVASGVLSDFSQVAEAAQQPVVQPVAKAAPDDLAQLTQEFGDAVQKAFTAEAPVDAKRQALAQIIRAFAEEAGGRLEATRPEEERIEKAVRQVEANLRAEIEALRAELAVAKSRPQDAEGDKPLVRKSLPGRRVILQPARVVKSQQERPTFLDLVTGQGGLLE